MLSAFAIWGTLSDGGPFARPNLNESFLLTIAFVISAAVPSLVLSADVVARRLSEERHRALVEHANDIVASLDLRITSVNPAIERILGFTPTEVIGRSLRRHVPQEQLHAHAEMLDRKFQGAPSTQYEIEVLTKAGVRRVLEVNSKLIADATGKPVAIHAIARDITERKEAKRGFDLNGLRYQCRQKPHPVRARRRGRPDVCPGGGAVQARNSPEVVERC